MSSHFDHLRAEDDEHVGYIEMGGDLFVPYDRLWNRRGEPWTSTTPRRCWTASG